MGAELTALPDGTYAVRTVSAGAVGSGAQSAGPNAESGFAIGAVAAPGVGATICTHTPPAGNAGELHEIEVTLWYSAGAPAANENSNMAFKFGGGNISNLPVPPALNVPVKSKFYFNAAVGTPFAIVAVNAATAGVTYCAFLTATRVVS